MFRLQEWNTGAGKSGTGFFKPTTLVGQTQVDPALLRIDTILFRSRTIYRNELTLITIGEFRSITLPCGGHRPALVEYPRFTTTGLSRFGDTLHARGTTIDAHQQTVDASQEDIELTLTRVGNPMTGISARWTQTSGQLVLGVIDAEAIAFLDAVHDDHMGAGTLFERRSHTQAICADPLAGIRFRFRFGSQKSAHLCNPRFVRKGPVVHPGFAGWMMGLYLLLETRRPCEKKKTQDGHG